MDILDRYIIKSFLSILCYAILAFIAIFVVVDLIEHLDDFLSNQATFYHAILYYLYYIPHIIILTLPANMLISSLFSLGNMAQHNELVACMSSGISLYRITLPMLGLALLISVIAGISGETIVPMTSRLRLDIMRYDIRNQRRAPSKIRSQIALQDRHNRQVNIGYYDGKQQRADKINVVRIKRNRIVERWDAKVMYWDSTEEAWELSNVIRRMFTDTSEVILYQDSLWYRDSQITPEDLLELQVKPEEMNYAELSHFVNKMLFLGADVREWLVHLYMKISSPFTNFIIVLFGAPLASRKRRSGPAMGFALALLICFVYFVFIRSGLVLGQKGTLNPWLGAWIGNIVFGIGGLFLMIWTKK